MSFPNEKRIADWYVTSYDGLVNLVTRLHSVDSPYLSQATIDKIFGMTEWEWTTFLRIKLEDHEIAASLALLATCEGAIRRDLEHRIGSQNSHHLGLRSLVKPSRHASIIEILAKWANTLGQGNYAYIHLKSLEKIYLDRNLLAHGRAQHGQFMFNLIRDRLLLIQTKWKQSVPDFEGF